MKPRLSPFPPELDAQLDLAFLSMLRWLYRLLFLIIGLLSLIFAVLTIGLVIGYRTVRAISCLLFVFLERWQLHYPKGVAP